MTRKFLTPIVLPANPATPLEAATKQYVDGIVNVNTVFPPSFDIIKGSTSPTGVSVSVTPNETAKTLTIGSNAASAADLDNTFALANSKVARAGDTMTGPLLLTNEQQLQVGDTEKITGIMRSRYSGVQLCTVTDGSSLQLGVNNSGVVFISSTDVTSMVPVLLPGAPTNPAHAATKQYVDDNAGGGGGSTDTVWVGTSAPADSAVELWYDTDDTSLVGMTQVEADGRYVNLDGDSMTGPLSVGNNVAIYGGWFDVAAPTTLRGSVTVGEGNTLNLTGPLAWPAGANIVGDATYGDLAVSAAGVGSISLKTSGTTRMAVESSRVIVSVPFEVSADPVAPLQVVTKGYAETNFVGVAGGTMTGSLVLSGAPTANLQAATKQYVDTVTINAQTGTTYTFALTDLGKLVTSGSATAATFTMPTNAAAPFPIGAQIHLIQWGAGKLTITGPDIRGTPSLIFRAQYSMATLIKLATEVWILVGDT